MFRCIWFTNPTNPEIHVRLLVLQHPSWFCGLSDISRCRNSHTYTGGMWYGHKIFKIMSDCVIKWWIHWPVECSHRISTGRRCCDADTGLLLAMSLLLATWAQREVRCENPLQSCLLSPHHYNGNHMTTTSSSIAMATTAPLLRQQLQSAITHISNLII